MSGEIVTTTGRSADTIVTEIIAIRDAVATTALVGACQVGKKLAELKEFVPHGEWGQYIKERLNYSQSQCNNLMRLYSEYGEMGPKSQSIGNLTPTAVLQLMAVPAEEREAFVEAHHVEDLSVSELKKKIREAQTKQAAAEKENDKLRLDNQAYAQNLASLRDLLNAAESALPTSAAISAEDAETLRAEGEARARKQMAADNALLAADVGQELDAEKAKVAEAEKMVAERDAQIAELKRQLAAVQSAPAAPPISQADADTIKLLFEEIGNRFNVLNGLRLKAQGREDTKTAGIISAMVRAQLQTVAKAFGVEVNNGY